MTTLIFLYGIRVATFFFSGVFFLKFWKASKDRFFLLFCSACWLLALECVIAVRLLAEDSQIFLQVTETSARVYFMRLLAFILIIAAIVEKNRSQKKSD